MKTRNPVRCLIIAPFLAIAMICGALTPLAPALADPVNPEDSVIEEATSPEPVAEAIDAKDAEDPADGVAEVETSAAQRSLPGKDASTARELSTTAAAATGLAPMRLKKSNGQSVTITVQMQVNALSVIDTIKAAKWPGVTPQDKDNLTITALMVMAQESTFYTNPSSLRPDVNQDVGPFQQRSLVGWYADGSTQAANVRTLNNIPYATKTFIEGHRVPRYVRGGAGPTGYMIPGVFQISNWRSDDLWRVAANVQRPASRYRYSYEYWRPVVEQMVEKLNIYASNPIEPSKVYTTPGNHIANGRQWRTTCEAYSTSVDRCRAEIWSTTVLRVGGRFVQKNAWNFNNLTYLPSPRSAWRRNPLATPGTFVSDGRQWKTECDNATTGDNGCRSYALVGVIEPYLDSRGTQQFRDVRKWVFNNIVQFSD